MEQNKKRKKYSKPKLSTHGDIKKITKGTVGSDCSDVDLGCSG